MIRRRNTRSGRLRWVGGVIPWGVWCLFLCRWLFRCRDVWCLCWSGRWCLLSLVVFVCCVGCVLVVCARVCVGGCVYVCSMV
nr:MAG TPA: hypothetical protein [Caudoviricetes sp.]